MRNTSIVKRGEFKHRVQLPKGVNEREKQMFIKFAKSVNQGLFKV
ncbi:hypothetical protein Aci011_062 [Acinetobacter phage vB_AbaM_B09_Aci01-1]|uniref:Uncharacterized protein n=3 Tax=Saclayvirus TaxID=2733128 RepID=A0A386KKH1_9CAUD|nr:hypothetical protein HOU29_gp119 [Acinetobacter phage vB_AbaM_B09_Aci01-1]YP_009813285.1 hypothetical protein HOU30_gp127 [Acinetobacter phage vB_AbaM_B09_Aci02-2]YP_009813915.1 hypothetical protein HOU35_gp116 [Acinetobacter phage vB_AbaM_B09_Aci05]AZF88462.1 hypothetical protein TAC_0074 [Acinetobacter phage TAC1]QMP19101.1 hypothetical protein FKOIJHOC_00153 [Acinetobacter phage Ab_121]UYL86118.1 putative lysozyme [Acinetobacter phage vB_AbaM_CP14]AYD82467.1 hypothetical protein Aci05_0